MSEPHLPGQTPTPKPLDSDDLTKTVVMPQHPIPGTPPPDKGRQRWKPPSLEELHELLPGYAIDKLLGCGGMGAVYRGVQTQLGRTVAIKLLPPDLEQEDPTFAERFKNEAKLMAMLAHPSIVAVYDFGQTAAGQLFFIMEYVDGTDVARMISSQTRLPASEALKITIQVCEALAAAHEVGIIHRDIKPANVLINAKRQVKVADFGLAQLNDAQQGLTKTGHAVGTPDYLAPEIYLLGASADNRTDLYSLGVMLYQMLTGYIPRGAFKPASLFVPGLNPRFDAIISRALQVDRSERYQSAAEMRHDLDLIATESSALPTLPPATAKRSASVVQSAAPRPTAQRTAAPASPPLKSGSRSTAAQSAKDNAQAAATGSPSSFWRSEHRTRLVTAAIGVLLCLAVGFLALRRIGDGLVMLSYDLPFLVHRAGSADAVRAVYLDELDGEFLDRRVQATLLDKLREAGAKAVIYDIIFDRAYPDPAVDEAFAAAIRRFRGVDKDDKPVPGARPGFVMLACGRKLLDQAGAAGEQLIPPTDVLLGAASDFGLVTLMPDDSYTVRELSTGTRDEASITWKTAMALGSKLEESKRLEPRWVNYAGPPPHPEQEGAVSAIRSCSVRNVIDGADPAFLRDKVVIVGGRPGIVSPKLGEDLFSTPFHRIDSRGFPLMSGVEVQANILANLLNHNWLTRSSHEADLLLILLVSLLAGVGLTLVRPLMGVMVTVTTILLLMIAGLLTIHYGLRWFPWSVAAFSQMPVALVWGTASRFYIERFYRMKLSEEQRRLREAFARYVSEPMLERLTTEGFHMKIGGEKVLAAMMFTDIEAFTDICQRVRDPEIIVENLNGYFERTTGHIFDHDGVVIKFIGDAIFAAWGVPFGDAQAPIKSVRAAWKLFENAKLLIAGDELRTRVGLHFGEVLAGNIGSSRHVDYTLIGDAVNLAARLEGLNKMLGTSILLSDVVYEHLNHEFCTRRVGKLRVKGRQDTTTVYELLGPATQTELPAWVNDYHAALITLEAGDFLQARRLFAQVDQARLHGDGPSRFFLELLERGERPLSGVVDLKEK
jgi:adenylate cyclase